MARQVRISDENAEWLSDQGGSLSQAADRTLSWARDVIDAVDNEGDEAPEPVDSYPSSPSGARRPVRTSAQSARSARFFAASARRGLR